MDRKAREIINLPVVTFSTGGKLASVDDLVIDPERRQVLALLLDGGGLFSSARAIPFGRIQAIGPDVVIIPDSKAALDIGRDPVLKKLLRDDIKVRGLRVVTEEGQKLGEVQDILLDDKTGEIKGFYIGIGKVVSVTQGLRWIPVENTIRMGYRILYVQNSVAQDIENQVGGIQGALDQVGDKVRTAGASANQRLVDAGGRVQTAGTGWNAGLGQLGSQLRQSVSSTTENLVVGRTAHETVAGPEGTPIVEAGQVITQDHVNLAKEQSRTPQLIKSAGVGPVRNSAGELGQQASDSFGDIRREASDLWAQLTGRYTTSVDQTDSKVMEKRIKAAVGRPVTRVILDQDDNVLLNTGDIITNRAVEEARQAGVLDVLVASVYNEKPALELADLKAPRSGAASLENQPNGQQTRVTTRPVTANTELEERASVAATQPIATTEPPARQADDVDTAAQHPKSKTQNH